MLSGWSATNILETVNVIIKEMDECENFTLIFYGVWPVSKSE